MDNDWFHNAISCIFSAIIACTLSSYIFYKEIQKAVELYEEYKVINCNTITAKELFNINKKIQESIVIDKILPIKTCKE